MADDEDKIVISIESDLSEVEKLRKGFRDVTGDIEKVGEVAEKTTADLSKVFVPVKTNGASGDLTNLVDNLQKSAKETAVLKKEQVDLADKINKTEKAAKALGNITTRALSQEAYAPISKNILGNTTSFKLNKYKDVTSRTKDITEPENIKARNEQSIINTREVNNNINATRRQVDIINEKIEADKRSMASLATVNEKSQAARTIINELNSALKLQGYTLTEAGVLMQNTKKDIDYFTKALKEEDTQFASVKTSLNKLIDEQVSLESSTKSQMNTTKNNIDLMMELEKTYKDIEALEKKVAAAENQTEKLALLDEQNTKLALSEQRYQALFNALKPYSDELKKISNIKLDSFAPVPGLTSNVVTESQKAERLDKVSSNLTGATTNLDNQRQATEELLKENAALNEIKNSRANYTKEIEITRKSIEVLTTRQKENKSTLTATDATLKESLTSLNSLTKVNGAYSSATLNSIEAARESHAVYEQSRKNTVAQIALITDEIDALKKQEIAYKAAQVARESRAATKELKPVVKVIEGANVSLDTTLKSSEALREQAAASELASLKSTDYTEKLKYTEDAIQAYSNSVFQNKAALKEASLTMSTTKDALSENLSKLDDSSPAAKRLQEQIKALTEAYARNQIALKEQNGLSEGHVHRLKQERNEIKSNIKVHDDAVKKMNSAEEKKAAVLRKFHQEKMAQQKQTASNMQGLSNLMGAWGRTFSTFVTAPIIAAGVQAVKFTAQMEMNIKSLEILLHNNADAAEELYGRVTAYAAATPYEIPDLTAATKQLLAFGSASKDVMGELAMLGDLAQNDAKKLESVTSAFGKVQARGTVHMRELNRFIMAGIPIIAELGEVMNQSSEELFKSVEQGNVSFASVKAALISLTSEGERFYGMSAKLSQTVSGRWSTLSDEINLALKSFAEDYMKYIKDVINWVIHFASAMQSVSKEQRKVILTIAALAAAFGPVLLMSKKLIATAKVLYLWYVKQAAVQSLIASIGAGPMTAIVMIAGLVAAGLAVNKLKNYVKDLTETFKDQETAVKSASQAIQHAYGKDTYDAVVKQEALILKEGPADRATGVRSGGQFSNVDLDVIEEMLKRYGGSDGATVKLAELHNTIGQYNKDISEAQETIAHADALWEKFVESYGIRDGQSMYARLSEVREKGQGDSVMLVQEILTSHEEAKQAIATIITLEAGNKKKIEEVLKSGTFVEQLSMVFLGTVTGAENVASVLNTLEGETKNIISSTLEQYRKYIGLIPQLDKLNEVYQEAAGIINLKDADIPDLLKSSGIKSTPLIVTMFEQLTGTPEMREKGIKEAGEMFSGLTGLISKTAKTYIDDIESEFRLNNLGDIMVGNVKGMSPDLIASKAEVIAKGYQDLVREAFLQIQELNEGASFDEVFTLFKESDSAETGGGLLPKLLTSLSTANSTKANAEMHKLIDKYRDDIGNVGLTETQIFENQVNAILDTLKDSEFYKELTTKVNGMSPVDQLLADFNEANFNKVMTALKSENDELTMTADAFKEAGYALTGFGETQIKALTTLEKYNAALKKMKDLGDSLETNTGLGKSFKDYQESYTVQKEYTTDLSDKIIADATTKKLAAYAKAEGKTYEEVLAVFNSPSALSSTNNYMAADLREINAEIDILKEKVSQPIDILSDDSVPTEDRKKALQALAHSLINADELTRKLTETDADYIKTKAEMSAADNVVWDDATTSAKLFKAQEQLIENQIAIREHGKDANQISIDMWKEFAVGVEPTSALGKAIAELITSYQELIDLDGDDPLTNFKDAVKELKEEIEAFYHTPREAMVFEIDQKQTELLQAYADDLKVPLAGIQAAFNEFALMQTSGELGSLEMDMDFQVIMNNIEKFRKYLQDKALQDIKDTAADYAFELLHFGKTDEEMVRVNLEKKLGLAGLVDGSTEYLAAQGDINNAVADYIALKKKENTVTLDKKYTDMQADIDGLSEYEKGLQEIVKLAISAGKSADDAKEKYKLWFDDKAAKAYATELKGYETQLKQLRMSDDEKAIDNLRQSGAEKLYTPAQIEALVTSLQKLQKGTSVKVYEDLMAGLNIEGLMAGKSDAEKWLNTNAAALKTYAENTNQTVEAVNALALAEYKATQVKTKLATALTSLSDKAKDYKEQVSKLGKSEREVLQAELQKDVDIAEANGSFYEYFTAWSNMMSVLKNFDTLAVGEKVTTLKTQITDWNKEMANFGKTDLQLFIAQIEAVGAEAYGSADAFQAAKDRATEYYAFLKVQTASNAVSQIATDYKDAKSQVPKDKSDLIKKSTEHITKLDNSGKNAKDISAAYAGMQAIDDFYTKYEEQITTITDQSDEAIKLRETWSSVGDTIEGALALEDPIIQLEILKKLAADLGVIDIGVDAARIEALTASINELLIAQKKLTEAFQGKTLPQRKLSSVSGAEMTSIEAGFENISEESIDKIKENAKAVIPELLHPFADRRIDKIIEDPRKLLKQTVGRAQRTRPEDRTESDNMSLQAWEAYNSVKAKVDESIASQNGVESVQNIKDMETAVGALNEQLLITKGMQIVELWEAFDAAMAGVGESLISAGFTSLISGLEEVGAAFAQGVDASGAFGDAMANTLVAMVDALPQLLLTAGLQLLTPATWGLGLALIAASGIAAIGKGAMHEKMDAMSNIEGSTDIDSSITYHAKGGAFDRGRILDFPTAFSGKNGMNVAGEAGTEAVVPLSRGRDGKLGVISHGGSGGSGGVNVAVPVNVTVVNQTGVASEAEVTQTTGPDGMQQIEILIKRVVTSGMASGAYDRTMNSRYGLKNRGIA